MTPPGDISSDTTREVVHKAFPVVEQRKGEAINESVGGPRAKELQWSLIFVSNITIEKTV